MHSHIALKEKTNILLSFSSTPIAPAQNHPEFSHFNLGASRLSIFTFHLSSIGISEYLRLIIIILQYLSLPPSLNEADFDSCERYVLES